jgi:type VI secretion system protein ImpF
VRSDEHEIRVVPSVLDRLIDREPGSPRDITPSRERSLRQYRHQVQRDLEHLLNARNAFSRVAPAFPEVGQSVIAYGLPDMSAMGVTTAVDQGRLRQAVEDAISTFEPRLTGVIVTLAPFETKDTTLRFHVEARLIVEPSPEAVAFDIDLPLQSGRCEVKERG